MRVPPVSGQRATRGWRQLLLLAPLLLASACFLLPKAEYPVCTRPPTDEDTEAAQGAHKAATRLYDKESYERAIEAWLAANWGPNVMHAVMRTIRDGYRKGVNPEMLGLVLYHRMMTAMDYPRPNKMHDLKKKLAKRGATEEKAVVDVVAATLQRAMVLESMPPPAPQG